MRGTANGRKPQRSPIGTQHQQRLGLRDEVILVLLPGEGLLQDVHDFGRCRNVPVITERYGDHGQNHGRRHRSTPCEATVKMTAEPVLYREWTTGFEPATLTLARLWFPSAETVPVP